MTFFRRGQSYYDISSQFLLFGSFLSLILPRVGGKTAERNKLDDILQLLKEFGGKQSKLAKIELKGLLFGSAPEAARKAEERREKERAMQEYKAAESAAKAESAKNTMNENMNALLQRGEKINAMHEKTQVLQNEAKTYADLASQLKEQVKGKKWYQL